MPIFELGSIYLSMNIRVHKLHLILMVGALGVANTGVGQPGSLDITFDPGVAAFPQGSAGPVAIQNDGMILLGGSFTLYQGVARPGLVRAFPNGLIDHSYVPPFESMETYPVQVFSVVVDSEGGCLVGGRFHVIGVGLRYLVRLNSDGSLDSFFDEALGDGFNGYVHSITIRENGNFVVGGSFTNINGYNRPYVSEFLSDGSLDQENDYGGGAQTFNVPDSLGSVEVWAVQCSPAGHVFVAGRFNHYGMEEINGFAVLQPNGSLEAALIPDLMAQSNGVWYPAWVSGMVAEPDGGVSLLGDFDTVNGISAPGMARLSAAGIVESTFSLLPDTIVNSWGYRPQGFISDGNLGYIFCFYRQELPEGRSFVTNIDSSGAFRQDYLIASSDAYWTGMYGQPNGDIFVVGNFTVWAGTSRNGLARLHGRNGPALWQCQNVEMYDLDAPGNLEVIGDTANWQELVVEQCMQLTLRTCASSGVEQFSNGLYTSCPAYPETMLPFSTSIPNACGGEDRIIEELQPGTYWLAVEDASGPYSFSIETELCGPADCLGTPGGLAQPGTACDDGDPATINDMYGSDCICQGEPDLNPDCMATPDGPALPGTPCDDGIFFTTNDAWTTDCICAGFDCAGIQGGSALPGNPCYDALTEQMDVWGVDCSCGTLTNIGVQPSNVVVSGIRPNPCALESFEVVFGRVLKDEVGIRLLDAVMREVSSFTHRPDGANTVHVDRNGVPAGSYFLEVQHPLGRSLHRVILQ